MIIQNLQTLIKIKLCPWYIFSGILLLFSFPGYSQNRAADSLEQLLGVSKEDTNKVITFLELVSIYRNTDPAKAKNRCYEAVQLAEKLKNDRFSARTYFNLAILLRRESNYEESIKFYLQSLKIFESLADKVNIGKIYGSLGITYWQQGNLDLAMSYYKKSLKIGYEQNDTISIGNTLNNIGGVYCQQQKYDSSLAFFRQSLDLSLRLKDSSGMAESYGNIGYAYYYLKDYNKALENYRLSMALSERTGNKFTLLTSYGSIGSTLAEQKKYDEAIPYFNKAVVLGLEISSKHNVADSYKSLAKAYAGKGNTALAYAYQVKYSELKDSLLNEANLEQINEMQARYESEKKDNEIMLLNKSKELQEAEIEKQKAEAASQAVIVNGLVIGLILLVGVAFLIYRSYTQKKKANIEIALQKAIIEEKNKEITDSIHYAKRIQGVLLTSSTYLEKNLPEHFVLYKPKDIVSGDFYWANAVNGRFLMTTADCTGHGVPGAFMSLLNITSLNEVTIERKIDRPDLVLNSVREEIVKALNPEGSENESKEGMDCVLCSFDLKNLSLEFACANNPLWIVRNNELIEFKPDKQPVGSHSVKKPFTLQSTLLQKGDIVYTFTDGYADQFGGPHGKKFKYSQLKEVLLSIQHKPMKEQKSILDHTIEKWKGNLEQVDDICVIGVRV